MGKIKFLLDADMPRSSAGVVRTFGFEVEDVRDINMGSAKDREIIEYAFKKDMDNYHQGYRFWGSAQIPKPSRGHYFRIC